MSACQAPQTNVEDLPTLVRFPTLTPTLHPSETLPATFTPTITSSPTITLTPRPTMTSRLQSLATDTITPTVTPSITPTATALPQSFIFGQSVEGRNLIAYRYGTGHHIIVIIGGIHAGFEANTTELVIQLQTHFQNNPSMIATDVTLIFIPSLNPDGATRGRVLSGRFNGNGVDLNRNWDCGWSEDAVFRDEPVDSGAEAFSEPETIALGSLIQQVQASAVIFYHAAANGVFAGDCGVSSAESNDLALVYGEASGYPYGEDFDGYDVTGTAPGWVHSIGIPALDVELASADAPEFDRNLRALMAVQSWVQGQ